MATSRRLVWRYYAFRVTNSAGFYVPVAILYLQDEGFGLDFVGLAYAVFSFAMVAAEIPTGYLGDWLGRRASLALGSACRAVTLGAYPFVESPLAYLGLHVLWATGWAFRSGTSDAWLYELLASRFDESEYAHVEGRGSTALLVTSAVTAVAGGVLYGIDPALPFLANAVLAALGLPILYTFPAVANDADEAFTVREAVEMLRLQASRPAVRWLVAYAALFQALFSVTRTLEQPALEAVGLPVAGLGLLYAGFKVVSASAASAAGWFEDHLGVRRVFALLVPVYGLAYAGVALAPLAVVPVLFLNRGLRVLTRPIRNQYLNDRLDDVGRATVLSGASMMLSLAGGTAKLVGGWAAARTGPVGILPWAGVATACVAGLLWLAVSPVRSDETTVDGETAVASD
ncbi:MFS transporter [halophilic archaeon]|nr:MFS transporter [halophilic archaeon]